MGNYRAKRKRLKKKYQHRNSGPPVCWIDGRLFAIISGRAFPFRPRSNNGQEIECPKPGTRLYSDQAA